MSNSNGLLGLSFFFFLTIFLCARYLKCTKNLIHIQIGGTWNICLTCVQEYLKLTNVKRGKAAGLVKDEREGDGGKVFRISPGTIF